MDIVGDDLYPQENDWYLPKQINRICTRDFSRYGMFAHRRLPYTLPIPEDILEYMYGENHEVLGVKGELKLLQRLHELSGTDVDICPNCDSHLIDPYSFNEYDQQIICPI
jgi:hypothetical protein